MTVFERDGILSARLAAALRGGIADSPRFRTPRSTHDDVYQLVFTAAPHPLPGGRFAYEMELMRLDQTGVPITVTTLEGSCWRARMVPCSSAILAHAAHALGY
ncbi:MAG: hypothetical protein ABIQ19_13390 [Sphingomonas sp.]